MPNFNLGFEYLGINFRSKVLANLTTFSTDATFTYLPRNSLALGANFVLDTKSSNLEKYDALLACFRSGQMSEAQLQAHMRDDPAFADYVREKVR